MNFDIESLISLMKKYTIDTRKSDLGEQEAAAGGSTTTSTSGGSGTGKTPKKWESGITKGKANQTANTKWESGRKFGKTYMNDPKYVWKSDRQMGKTGGTDYA